MIEKKISVICPTHRRAKLQTRFAEKVYENCSSPEDCEIIFGIDNDDEIALKTAEELIERFGEDFIRVCLIEPGENLPNISNICARTTARGFIYGNAADDVVFKSKNWDSVVLNEFDKFDDKILLLWSDDGNWNGTLAAHYFVSKNWFDVLGHIQPTFFHADWTDHWNQTLAKSVGRAKVIMNRETLFLHHLHAELGGMEKDETYWKVKAKRERNVKEGLTFHNPTEEMKIAFAEQRLKLMKFIKDYSND